jgi:HD-like signal output (HDOD) protein
LNLVRDAVFEATISKGVFDVPEYRDVLDQVRRHSIVTAYLSRIICQHTGTDSSDLFVAGLIHDVGFAGLLLAVTDIETPAPPLETFWGDVEALHERATSKLFDLWRLPECYAKLVKDHHTVCTDAPPARAALTLADHLSSQFGAEISGPLDDEGKLMTGDCVSEKQAAAARHLLGVTDEKLGEVLQHAELVIPNIVWL